GAALPPHRALRLPPRGARTFRQAAALSPRTAGTTGAVARARSRPADRRGADHECDLRRRHAGASRQGARAARLTAAHVAHNGSAMKKMKIAFQGEPGANSDI